MTNYKSIIIVGGHEQACNILDHLITLPYVKVVLCIIRKDDTGQDGIIFPSLLQRARKYDIPTLQPEKINANAVLSIAYRINPDLVLSLQNNMIFGGKWLELLDNKLGIVNVHYAPLPKYGGYWPEMWAIWNAEKKFAVSMHYVEKGLDTGPIIHQRWFDITELENRRSLYNKCTDHCFTMIIDNLGKILEGKVKAISQGECERSYFPKSLPNDGFIDLSWDGDMQSRFIRAISFPGFPGPKIKIGTEIYTILAEDLPFFEPVNLLKIKPNHWIKT